MKNVLETLPTLIKQLREYFGSYEDTKPPKSVVDKIGEFEGKNITNL